MENKSAKYKAMTTLSAAIAAVILLPLTSKVSATATKFTAPPICLAASALAIFHPSLFPNDVKGMKGKTLSVPAIVENAPIIKAIKSVPVSAKTRRRSESKRSRGTASGTRLRFTRLSSTIFFISNRHNFGYKT